MPSVIEAPVRIDHAAHDLQDEQPQGRVARSGFWHRLVQSVRGYRVHPSSRTPSSTRSARRQSLGPSICSDSAASITADTRAAPRTAMLHGGRGCGCPPHLLVPHALPFLLPGIKKFVLFVQCVGAYLLTEIE